MDLAAPRAGYRPRPPPPPIRLPSSPSGSRPTTPTALAGFSPQKLLYELPPSTSLRSPPPKPPPRDRAAARSRSPPSASARRTSFGAALQTRSADGQDVFSPVPSPKRHVASLGGNEPKQSELDSFAEACRRWYYEQNELAGRQMTHALAGADPSHRATYTRIQAAVRSTFHADQTLRRIMEFRALVSSFQPGHSLSAPARANPNSPMAKKERYDKLVHFIQTYCLSDMPGTHPFFTALYGLLRLQSLPDKLGGAGERVVEWELDDAVFLESAGKDFTSEAITVLKGVLGFDEATGDFAGSLPEPDSAFDEGSDDEDSASFRPTPSSTQLRNISPSTSYASTPLAAARARTTSDPFIDPSRSYGSSLAPAAASSPPDPLLFDGSATPSTNSIPLTPSDSSPIQARPRPPPRGRARKQRTIDLQKTFSEPYFRVWTFPTHLANPELHQLCALFPSFITKRAMPRFPVGVAASRRSSVAAAKDGVTPRELESGLMASSRNSSASASIMNPGEIRVGTGKMRVGEQKRAEGWRGSLWQRIGEWFRNMFR